MSECASKRVKVTSVKISAKDEYMCDDHLDFFKGVLNDWRDQVLKESNDTLNGMRAEKEVYSDEVDIATQEEAFRLELRARDRGRKLLKKIDQSLDELKNGEYGYCEDCGSEIGIPRLQARPTATKCIECKTVSELKEKHLIF